MIRLFCKRVALLKKEGLRAVVVPMLPREDDRLCRALAEALGGVLAEGLTPSAVIDLMRESRGVYGMRLHSLVFAALADVPFVGFGTDEKIQAFCRERGGTYFTDCYRE